MSSDLEDMVPHEDDLVVISVITMGRKVHRVLIDQECSIDVMFCSTFKQFLVIPRPAKGVRWLLVWLCGKSGGSTGIHQAEDDFF